MERALQTTGWSSNGVRALPDYPRAFNALVTTGIPLKLNDQNFAKFETLVVRDAQKLSDSRLLGAMIRRSAVLDKFSIVSCSSILNDLQVHFGRNAESLNALMESPRFVERLLHEAPSDFAGALKTILTLADRDPSTPVIFRATYLTELVPKELWLKYLLSNHQDRMYGRRNMALILSNDQIMGKLSTNEIRSFAFEYSQRAHVDGKVVEQLVKSHIASRLKSQDWALILQNVLRKKVLEPAALKPILQNRAIMERLPQVTFDLALHRLLFQSSLTDMSIIAGFASDHNLYRIKKFHGELFWINAVNELISSGKADLAAHLVTLHRPFLLVPTDSYEAFLGFLFEPAKTEPLILESLKSLPVESRYASDHWFNFIHDCLKEERFNVVLGILPFARTVMSPEAHARLRLEVNQLAPGVMQSQMARILPEPHPLTQITSFVATIPQRVGLSKEPPSIRSIYPVSRRIDGGPRAGAGALHQRIPVVQAPRNPLVSTFRGFPIVRF